GFVEAGEMRGHRVERADFDIGLPLVAGGGLEKLLASIGSDVDCVADTIVVVGHEASEARSLLEELAVTSGDVDAVQVEQTQIAIIDANENLVGEALADRVDLCGDFWKGREILDFAGIQMNAIDVIVFVAVLVLSVKDVLAGVGPTVVPDTSMLVESDGLGLRGIVVGADPHVQHAFNRCDESNPLAVVA